MPNLRIINLLICAGVHYASIVTDSATLKATSPNIVTESSCRHSSACDLDRTEVLNKLLLADVVSLWLILLFTDWAHCSVEAGLNAMLVSMTNLPDGCFVYGVISVLALICSVLSYGTETQSVCGWRHPVSECFCM